ncbi:MAG: hypothetical protein AABX70_02790 [Nanoarchaeota archaeon]
MLYIQKEDSELRSVVKFLQKEVLVTRAKQLIGEYIKFMVLAAQQLSNLFPSQPISEGEAFKKVQATIDSFVRAKTQLEELENIIKNYGEIAH